MRNFPVPYSNELIYSTIARAGVYQGIVSPKQLLDEVSELEKPSKSKKVSAIKVVKPSDWDSLPDTDLRYIYSQRQPEKTMHERLKGKGVIVDMASLFKQAG